MVQEILDLYKGGGERNVRIESDLPDDLPLVRSRADELKEVLINVLENARIAMPAGGRIRIAARSLAEGPAEGGVELTVEDDGVGIPAALLSRIFEPQFSTRSTGTGLGLAIVQRLVDSWGGEVEAWSEEGVGTRITVRMPGAEALALATGTPAGVRADTAGPAHRRDGYRLAPRMPTNRIGRGTGHGRIGRGHRPRPPEESRGRTRDTARRVTHFQPQEPRLSTVPQRRVMDPMDLAEWLDSRKEPGRWSVDGAARRRPRNR